MTNLASLFAGLFVLYAATASAQVSPKFLARQDVTGLYSQYTGIGDTNGDGIPDLIVSAESYITVLFGNGDGTFRIGPSENTYLEYPTITLPVDINGDGILDLVFGGYQTESNYDSGITVALGNGDGTFQYGDFYPAGTDTGGGGGTIAADFNGDGKLDVAFVAASGVWMYLGKGDGTFHTPFITVPLAPGAGGLAAADFNGDGKLDLVITLPEEGFEGTGNGFDVAFGNGDGTFQTPVHYAQPIDAYYVTAGPVTKDGRPGFALTQLDINYTLVYTSDGAGGFTGPRIADVSGLKIVLADVNGDGYPDVVASSGAVAYGSASGQFTKTVTYPALTGFTVAVGDLRNNGRQDIVTDAHDGISVLLNEGGDQFQEGNFTPLTGGAGCTVSADFNGDGKPDLAVSTASGVTIVLGTSSLSKPLQQGPTVSLPNAGCAIAVDLNKDGIEDLLVPTPTAVVTLIGNGDGTFTQTFSTATSYEGYLAVADFDHDGKLDFATSANLMAFGNGDGTFRKAKAIVATPPSGGFSAIAAGDINNDGWSDLILTSSAFPYVNAYVLLNNQHGGFTQVPSSMGEFTDQAILVDFNGDGNLDVVFAGEDAAGAYIYLGDGTGNFTKGTVLGSFIGGTGVNVVADFNGDGIPDIGVQSSPSVALFLGKGDGTFEQGEEVGTYFSPGFPLVARLHGQHIGTPPDLVVPDYSGGILVLFNETK